MVDMTNVSNISSLQGIAYYTNNMTDGLLFTGGIIVFFFIILMALVKSGQPFENGLAVASWSMFIVSVLFWFAQLVSPLLCLGFLVVAAFDVLYLFASRK
jgi:hypothetical protein